MEYQENKTGSLFGSVSIFLKIKQHTLSKLDPELLEETISTNSVALSIYNHACAAPETE